MWERVIGQERALRLLHRAAGRPVHAYLLSGPPGSGVETAARCMAAALLCGEGGCGECSACTRVLRGRHPDSVEVEPEGRQLLAEQAGEAIREAFSSPVEAERKVIIVFEAERMNEAAQNKLLKSFEEPPPTTFFLLVTSSPDELLPTVRSRCQPVEFGALADTAVTEALVSEGVPPDRADVAARLAGGRLDRARRLTGEYATLRQVFAGVPGRIDGTGGRVATMTVDLVAIIDEAVKALEEGQAAELAALEEEAERSAYSDRTIRAMRRRLAERHRRAQGRARLDALGEGLTAMESVYRDALVAPAEPLNPDLPPPAMTAAGALDALDAVADAHRALEGAQLNQSLLLHHLLLRLPAMGMTEPSKGG
jgi:DNA polymerase III subunit delta'